MAKKYTEIQLEELVTKYLNNEDINFFYKQNFINWVGRAKNNIFYSEIISKVLMANDFIEKINMIKPIGRINEYPKRSLEWRKDNNSSHLRREEHIVYFMHDTNKQYSFGKMVNYQIPLKGNQADKSGKIDFISIDENKKVIHLCEIKNDRSKETLLRCILEIATYYQQLDCINFKKYMLNEHGVDYPIVKSVVIFKGTKPFKDYCNLNNTPMLERLINLLRVNIIVLDRIEDEF